MLKANSLRENPAHLLQSGSVSARLYSDAFRICAAAGNRVRTWVWKCHIKLHANPAARKLFHFNVQLVYLIVSSHQNITMLSLKVFTF